MAVYLGTAGLVQLQRSGAGVFRSRLDPGDVDPVQGRFSFDFPNGTFVTGDRIRLERLDGQPLDFVAGSGWADGAPHVDGEWFVNVDPVGGIRLFHSWAEALTGSSSKAVPLRTPSAGYAISASIADGAIPRCLGEVTSYELATNRAAIDVTSLGDAFTQQVSGLISGGGSLECFWDWQPTGCNVRGIGPDVELAHYAHQLVLRQQLGSQFRGVFFLKTEGAEPVTDALDGAARKAALFYAVDCLITDAAVAFEPGEPVRSKISFVTTGEISLLFEVPHDYLLQEDAAKIDLETGDGEVLLEF